MLRILRSTVSGGIVFALSGHIKEEYVSELTELLGNEKDLSIVSFDLEEVRLVHREAVRFLAACEERGVMLNNCPAFVREWIQTGSDIRHESKRAAIPNPQKLQHGI
jgi:hypothetical protein